MKNRSHSYDAGIGSQGVQGRLYLVTRGKFKANFNRQVLAACSYHCTLWQLHHLRKPSCSLKVTYCHALVLKYRFQKGISNQSLGVKSWGAYLITNELTYVYIKVSTLVSLLVSMHTLNSPILYFEEKPSSTDSCGRNKCLRLSAEATQKLFVYVITCTPATPLSLGEVIQDFLPRFLTKMTAKQQDDGKDVNVWKHHCTAFMGIGE